MNKQLQSIFEAIMIRLNNLDKKYDFPSVRNSNGVSENGEGIIDLADLADENASAIEELADMIADLEERVSVLEEK